VRMRPGRFRGVGDPGSPRNRRFRGVEDGPGKGAPTQWGCNGPHPVDRRSRPVDTSSTASSELALSGGASQRDLADEFRAGKVRGLARAITLVEQRDASVRHLLESLGELGRLPYVVGLTGAPGTGKSTLADSLVALLRSRNQAVAVIAVD